MCVRNLLAFSLRIWYTMCMKDNLIHSRTCVYNINYHVVWSVKYRRKILTKDIEEFLKELVQQIARDKGFTVHLFEACELDHIHCFVSAPPKLSVTDIVKYLKGITGRKPLNSIRKSDKSYGKDNYGITHIMLKPLVLYQKRISEDTLNTRVNHTRGGKRCCYHMRQP